MSRVFCAGGLAHVGGKRSADDHESECEGERASSHLCPSIPNRHQAPSCLMSFSTVRPVARYDGRNEVLAMRRVGTYHVRIGSFILLTLVALPACSSPTSPTSEITRDRAIDLARQHVSFEPTSTAADKDSRQGRPVWVVTFRRADGSHGGLGLFAEVSLDRRTGELVTVAMS
jgi:hypothetical protein